MSPHLNTVENAVVFKVLYKCPDLLYFLLIFLLRQTETKGTSKKDEVLNRI